MRAGPTIAKFLTPGLLRPQKRGSSTSTAKGTLARVLQQDLNTTGWSIEVEIEQEWTANLFRRGGVWWPSGPALAAFGLTL
jgi:hypothetical protein